MSAQQQVVITAAEVRAAEIERRSVKVRIGERYGIDPEILMGTLRSTVFKGDVTTEQLIMLLVVADQHKLNPFTKEIYAFPSRQGIVPVVGVDGWAKIVNDHPQFDGMEFALSGELGEKTDTRAYTCTIHRKDREHPVSVTEYMSECRRGTEPWNTHPLRMLRHKAMIQCARLAFSFSGIYDPDEGERVLAAENAIDVTPTVETNFGAVKISPVKKREIIEGLLAACKADDLDAFAKVYIPLTNGEKEVLWKELRSYERSAIKKLEDRCKKAGVGVEITPWSLSLIAAVKTPEALADAWKAIQDAFAADDKEVPPDIETMYQDRKAEFGA